MEYVKCGGMRASTLGCRFLDRCGDSLARSVFRAEGRVTHTSHISLHDIIGRYNISLYDLPMNLLTHILCSVQAQVYKRTTTCGIFGGD